MASETDQNDLRARKWPAFRGGGKEGAGSSSSHFASRRAHSTRGPTDGSGRRRREIQCGENNGTCCRPNRPGVRENVRGVGRTGLFALASGVGARRLLEGIVPNWTATGTGVVLLLFSAFCFSAGVWRHLFRVEAPVPETRRLPSSVLVTVNVLLALVALTALIGIMVGGQAK